METTPCTECVLDNQGCCHCCGRVLDEEMWAAYIGLAGDASLRVIRAFAAQTPKTDEDVLWRRMFYALDAAMRRGDVPKDWKR